MVRGRRGGGRRDLKGKGSQVLFWTRPIWSQVSSSQNQSSPVNHHPSGCWHSQRPGSNLCRSSDPSTHNSIPPPPKSRRLHQPNPSRRSLPCWKSIPPHLQVYILSTCFNITKLLLHHSAMTGLFLFIHSRVLQNYTEKMSRWRMPLCSCCVVIPYYQHSVLFLDIGYQRRLKPKSTPFVCKIPECCIITVQTQQRSSKQWTTEEEVTCLLYLYLKKHANYPRHAW